MAKNDLHFLLKPDLECLCSPTQIHLAMARLFIPPNYNNAGRIVTEPENINQQPTPTTQRRPEISQICSACLRSLNNTQIPIENRPITIPISSSTPQNNSQIPSTPAVSISSKDKWIIAQHGCIPSNTVEAGYNFDHSKSYVCRAFHNGEFLPGKHSSKQRCVHVTLHGEGIRKNNYEFLVGAHYKWVTVVNGIPASAVKADRHSLKEHLYFGRTYYKGRLICGTIRPSHSCLYIYFCGQEIIIDDNYEILLRKD